MLADETVAQQLLGNLFENSVRYAARGVVTISAYRRGKRVEVVVADEGKGVEPGALERLFEPFYRADPSRSRKTGATGLGLMIARRAVEAHGGSIFARQAQTGGLEVVFDLPATDESSGTAAL